MGFVITVTYIIIKTRSTLLPMCTGIPLKLVIRLCDLERPHFRVT